MVRTEVLSGHQEHLLAYLLTGMVVASAEAARQIFRVAVFLALVAAVLELGQFASPGREPTLTDFAVSALGV
ncbi:MAG: hypothetical protein M5U16_05465 [Hyphomicrobium sp.]|nr:hypothetical protein [Hyphomicrobium sp.]